MTEEERNAKLESASHADIIRAYLLFRKRKAELETAHKVSLAKIEAVMDRLEAQMLDRLNTHGVRNFATDHGTAIRVTKTFARLVDRPTLIDYVRKVGDFDLFTNHISKSRCVDIRAATKLPPPGVEMQDLFAVNFRIPGAKADD